MSFTAILADNIYRTLQIGRLHCHMTNFSSEADLAYRYTLEEVDENATKPHYIVWSNPDPVFRGPMGEAVHALSNIDRIDTDAVLLTSFHMLYSADHFIQAAHGVYDLAVNDHLIGLDEQGWWTGCIPRRLGGVIGVAEQVVDFLNEYAFRGTGVLDELPSVAASEPLVVMEDAPYGKQHFPDHEIFGSAEKHIALMKYV